MENTRNLFDLMWATDNETNCLFMEIIIFEEHEFPKDCDLYKEYDKMDIDGEPLLFEAELATQADAKKKQKSKRTKAYTRNEDKHLCGCWVHGGKEVVEEHGEGEKYRLRGKTNSNKEDKREVTSLALQATFQGMITNNDSREEKHRQDKDEKIKAFMEIQKKKLELEAEKQVNMLEIEATKSVTRVREVLLACMTKGVEIMKVDLSIVSPREWSWFEKMQANMLNLNDE
ncbi:Phospholipid-transporting ATPase 1 [Hordeum vulgare]|nr:Phospholipid-transporting ATPase 1 [Hordeum vulgare]